MTPRDPYLDLPLDGLRLIEASAGTGKTFTLATLVTRLVVERGLRVGQILAVTFTEAATQELRHRIRARLERTLQVLEGDDAAMREEGSAEDGIGREILQAHLAAGHEDVDTLRRRLQQAVHEIDLAAIFTIHGFCSRALSEHALDSGQGFDPPEQLTSDKALRGDLAADLWRAFAAEAADAALLTELWSGPEALAEDLRALLDDAPLRPGRPVDAPDPKPALQSAFDALRLAFAADQDAFLDAMRAALEGGVLNKNGYQKNLLEEVWCALAEYCAQDDATCAVDPRIERLGPAYIEGKLRKGREDDAPRGPLSDAIAHWIEARERREAWRIGRRTGLLHRIRDAARQRLDVLKRQRRVRTYDDLIRHLADALEGPRGDVLAQRLRDQYAIALVDEFQDTDTRQWSIFQRVFGDVDETGGAPALFLIGDPKQAIYGFRGGDVQTYLAAKQQAEAAPALTHNFRSRPSVLDAIAALYANARRNGDTPFVVDGIDFQPVLAGGGRHDRDFMRDGRPAPALTVCRFPITLGIHESGERKGQEKLLDPMPAEESRKSATEACAAAIHGVLSDAGEGRAILHDKDGAPRPVQAGDIAVLVRNHKEASRIQRALAAAGIPAVAAGKQSLFDTDEAGELRCLFEALLQPADDGRLRAALATVLVGCDAADIAALDTDPIGHARWQHAALQWRDRWQRSGPLALVADLCATHAPRLLGLLDGERRLTNLMQLGELLQEADARALGLHGLVDWLRGRIADADSDDESQLLRLESDARRVQIVTLHKSKGLEYPLVYLPFVGIGSKPPATERHTTVQTDEGGGRVLHWKIDKHADDWKAAQESARQAREAEDARLLYVGLTRAQDALWLASGPFRDADTTRVWPMLKALDAMPGTYGIAFTDGDALPTLRPLPAHDAIDVPPARVAARVLPRDWWVYSFSQLTRADGGEVDGPASAVIDERGANDEPPPIDGAEPEPTAAVTAIGGDDLADDRRFGGTVFGNALHEALENIDFAAWRHWRGGPAPGGQDMPLREALARGGFADADIDDGATLLAQLIGHTLTVQLPEGGRLADTPAWQRRAEMEFHFALQPTAVDALFALLHRHGVVPRRHAFGLRRRLEGLMTGKIDLTYVVDGRWYVLDYKSNRLPAYDPAALESAMQHSEYDLQALVYTVALHRWLRFRLGDAYEYARDMGGVRYLFCRGLHEGNGHGIHAHRPDPALVQALDALFAGQAVAA
ncbi:UvrD-helicase domain-containing protein [Marilutibacter aestuarii]|uniref:RecBCD enzyme subunit RecB n=1 Tax=Marilutibacter aestuarii TaxID=1706195 RepID=A0A508A9H5_9GAMM|nr:exodeoxyribonuclease V subunit beta [Lysobacter aestuarii]TQD46649.1 AAA family ATPase [Lysobacter aestuarii]